MSRRKPGEPFPSGIWVNVLFDNVPSQNRGRVASQLRLIRGWSTAMLGDNGGALRYKYKPKGLGSILGQARTILTKGGASIPNVNGFVIWRMDLSFYGSLPISVFAPLTDAMREVGTVLSVHGLGNNHAGVYVEFRDEPPADVLQRVRSLAAPYMTRH